MGLDITAFSNVRAIGPMPEDVDWDEIYDNDQRIIFVNPHFPLSGQGLLDNYIYDVSQSKAISFAAGSYGGYNVFRSLLAKAAGYDHEDAWSDEKDFQEAPFFEIVNFSDCEGTIGPVAALHLYHDFVTHRDKFIEEVKDDTWKNSRIARYDFFTKAFRLASDKGFVIFH